MKGIIIAYYFDKKYFRNIESCKPFLIKNKAKLKFNRIEGLELHDSFLFKQKKENLYYSTDIIPLNDCIKIKLGYKK